MLVEVVTPGRVGMEGGEGGGIGGGNRERVRDTSGKHVGRGGGGAGV